MMHARWINGNLAYWDTHQCRIVAAEGATVTKHVEEFVRIPLTDGATTLAGYTVTVVSGGAGDSIAAGTAVGGTLVVTTADQENDGYNIQLNGESFKLASAKPAYFGTRLKISDATQSDLLVGLCITDTDLLGGLTDGAYFRKVDGSAACSFVLEKNSAETTGTAHTMVDDTFVTLEFYFDGTSVDFWVDGTLKTRLAVTNIPDDEELTPSIHWLAGAGAAKALTVDWVRVFQFN